MPFSLNDKHIVVNYHYIEDLSEQNRGMHPCSISEFEKHIRFLSKHYKPASIEEVFSAAKNGSEERYYSITFDDGLKSQCQNAVPILKKYSTHATFFPIIKTLNGIIPTTHKIHILLSNISSDEFIDFSNKFLEGQFPKEPQKYFVPKGHRISPDRRLYEDVSTANLKEVFVSLPNDILEQLVNSYFARLELNEQEYCRNLFMSQQEIKTLEEEGFTIGNHTYEHYSVNTLSPDELRSDINKSRRYFEKILRNPQNIFCYPHGILHTETPRIIEDLGFTHAVTVEMRGVSSDDDPFLIPRYDRVNVGDFLAEQVV